MGPSTRQGRLRRQQHLPSPTPTVETGLTFRPGLLEEVDASFAPFYKEKLPSFPAGPQIGFPNQDDYHQNHAWATTEGDHWFPQYAAPDGVIVQPELPAGLPPFPSAHWLAGVGLNPPRPSSTVSSSTRASSLESTGSSLSPVQTDVSDTRTIRSRSRNPSPLRKALGDPSPHVCNWAGCDSASFATRAKLVWHVQAEHLLICPAPGCTEKDFGSTRLLSAHLSVVHPDQGIEDVKDWQLVAQPDKKKQQEEQQQRQQQQIHISPQRNHFALPPKPAQPTSAPGRQGGDIMTQQLSAIARSKRKCQEQLRSVVEKKAKRKMGQSPPASSPSDFVRNRVSSLVDTASFPIVFEHSVLPFLVEFIPVWAGPRHVISVCRGKTRESRRISIMTEKEMSFTRKVIIARHVRDLLPENHRPNVSFTFPTGKVCRTHSAWARGLSKEHPDDICMARNPYCFRVPCMGDSVGIAGNESHTESTATLGPCLDVDGGTFWLCNFHPFLEAYGTTNVVKVEHPSPRDRASCIENAHDAISPNTDFHIGDLVVTSGLNLQTTRISHDPYWEDCGKEPPLVVTDWALVSSHSSRANMLRRFPSETHPTTKEALVKLTSAVSPGASVLSSGRTSGFQRGQICEIPAYISGEENGTEKATREWFIEEPWPCNDEEAWIRGGIGVEGDSGAAVVDTETHALVGQIWGRNKYFGAGQRITFFTPVADIFDDIQEKCGQEKRPQLPQYRDEADRLAMLPTCRQCYDLRTYLDSRRSSRVSLASMMISGDADHDVTSIEAVSELDTPRDYSRGLGPEEAFLGFLSPGQHVAISEGFDVSSPYARTLELDTTDEDAKPVPTSLGHPKKRTLDSMAPVAWQALSSGGTKKQKTS